MNTLLVPLVTPFDADGSVATGALERLARDVLTAGATGIVALGTTGEPATLSDEERRTVLEICARVCHEHDALLVAGAGGNDTARSVAALRSLPEAAAALVVVPYYTRPSADGVVAHFQALAKQSPVPILVYHVPHRTGAALCAGTLLRLAEIPGIAGMKLATGSVDADVVRLLAEAPADFAVLAGDDHLIAPLLAMGAKGAIAASAHVCTEAFAELIARWRDGEVPRELGHRLSHVSAALFAAPNPTVIKAVLYQLGRIPTPAVRLPLTQPDPELTRLALTSVTRFSVAAC